MTMGGCVRPVCVCVHFARGLTDYSPKVLRTLHTSGRRCVQLKDEVGCPRQPIVSTMLRNLDRIEVGRCKQEENA